MNEISPHKSSVGLRLTRAVCERSGLEPKHAKEAVKALMLALKDLLLSEDEVAIPFLGVLRLQPEEFREFMVEGVTYRIALRKRIIFRPFSPFLRRLFTENKRVYPESEPVENETEDKGTDDEPTEGDYHVHLCPLPIRLEVRQK